MTQIIPLNIVDLGTDVAASISGLDNDKTYAVKIRAVGINAASAPSKPLDVTPHPTPTPAPITDKTIESDTGKRWSTADGYEYIYWTNGGAFTAHVYPSTMTVDLIIVGGGGGGRGQVLPMAQGGDGGGGEVFVSLGMTLAGGLLIGAVGAGAQGGGTLPGGDSTFSYYKAIGGGTSQGKTDGLPAGARREVPDEFKSCAAFSWNVPLSYALSGTTPWDKKSQPNGIVYGQGGGGTNGTVGDSKCGDGATGIVCIRWKK